jgi:thiol-disulfide isomerase/thioredoxin
MVNWSSKVRIKLCLLAIGLAQTALGCAQARNDPHPAAASAQRVDAAITLPDVTGKMVQPLVMEPEQHAAVLIFVTTECPICNAYAGEINRLNQAYATRGVRFFLVDVDLNLSAHDALQHAHEYSLSPTVLLDPNQVLAKKYAATTTPEVVLIDQTGSISYRGRIDDLYVSLGQRRYEAREHDLRDALDAVIAGRPVPVAVTQAVGCAI